ncbi:MAG: queuosine precursor transporter [Gammaproteobacteria bacterium]|nr:queuosine precursor transporter [Gammaproteobacteria bacterium]
MSNTIGTLSNQSQYKYPFLFLGIYLTFLLATVCLAGKLALIGNLLVPGGIFVFGFTFSICEIVGEVYGYSYPRLFIWTGVLAEIIFALVVTGISHLSSPEYFKHQEAYWLVFDPTLRYVVSSLVGLMVGEFVNVYLLAKWKIAWRGKFFIGRSLVSAGLGQATLTIIVDILNYYGKISSSNLVWMMISGYLWKMCGALILVFPAWLLVKYLKKVEEVDHYDINTNFNPFIFRLDEKQISLPNKQFSFSSTK